MEGAGAGERFVLDLQYALALGAYSSRPWTNTKLTNGDNKEKKGAIFANRPIFARIV